MYCLKNVSIYQTDGGNGLQNHCGLDDTEFRLTNGTQYCPKSMSLKKLMKQSVENMKKKLERCMIMKVYFSWIIYEQEGSIKCYDVQYQEEVECKEGAAVTTYAVCEESKSYVLAYVMASVGGLFLVAVVGALVYWRKGHWKVSSF